MGTTAIVTDTGSGLSMQQAEALGVYVIPIPFMVDGVEYLEGVDFTAAEFFAKMRAGAQVSTSQPAPHTVAVLWERLLETYDNVMYFPISSALSGSCHMAKVLAQEYHGRVTVVDNGRVSLPQLEGILDAKELLGRGESPQRVRELLEKDSKNSCVYVAVNTLKYLRKSGRVTAAGAAMATILNIKPVLRMQGDLLDAFKKARGMRYAKQVMLDVIRKMLDSTLRGKKVKLFVANAGFSEECAEWSREVQAAFPAYRVEGATLPMSICCHLGEGTLGIAYVEKCTTW